MRLDDLFIALYCSNRRLHHAIGNFNLIFSTDMSNIIFVIAVEIKKFITDFKISIHQGKNTKQFIIT